MLTALCYYLLWNTLHRTKIQYFVPCCQCHFVLPVPPAPSNYSVCLPLALPQWGQLLKKNVISSCSYKIPYLYNLINVMITWTSEPRLSLHARPKRTVCCTQSPYHRDNTEAMLFNAAPEKMWWNALLKFERGLTKSTFRKDCRCDWILLSDSS